MNQWLALLVSALAFGTPLLLAALGETAGEKSGVLNIGLEGMMLAGAWAGVAAGWATGNAGVGVLTAMGAGAILAAIFGFLVLSLRADAVVAGTGLNLFALGLTGVLHRALATRAGTYNAATLPQPFFWLVGFVSTVLLASFLARTRGGLQLRACGEYPAAARAAGIGVKKLQWAATLFCGAMCGLGGAFLSMSHTDSFNENMTAGSGFIALTIVILGRWNTFGALAAALLFGFARALQFRFQSALDESAYPLMLALPYFLTLLCLAGFAGTTRAPAALNVRED